MTTATHKRQLPRGSSVNSLEYRLYDRILKLPVYKQKAVIHAAWLMAVSVLRRGVHKLFVYVPWLDGLNRTTVRKLYDNRRKLFQGLRLPCTNFAPCIIRLSEVRGVSKPGYLSVQVGIFPLRQRITGMRFVDGRYG
jgi:hypothetical protein